MSITFIVFGRNNMKLCVTFVQYLQFKIFKIFANMNTFTNYCIEFLKNKIIKRFWPAKCKIKKSPTKQIPCWEFWCNCQDTSCLWQSALLGDPMLCIRYPSAHHPPKKQFPELFFFTVCAIIRFKSCRNKKKNQP